jgi:hypothetical protein
MTEMIVRHIPEIVVPGKPLGRHVRHDPRSLAYLVESTTVPVSKTWKREVPVFDQGSLGSCTGNAAVGVLGTDPFFATMTKDDTLDEAQAVAIYSAATRLDSYFGSYPPDDTGSDGLSVAKAAKNAGLISGYLHMTSVAACQAAIQTGPFIIGSDWYQGFDDPDLSGVLSISGSIRGGHEYECIGYDAPTDRWHLVNSWGDGWGDGGHFYYSSDTLAELLDNDGDATSFVPINQPPPTPDPGAASFPGAFPAVDARIVALAHRRGLTPAAWMNHHFQWYFRFPQ